MTRYGTIRLEIAWLLSTFCFYPDIQGLESRFNHVRIKLTIHPKRLLLVFRYRLVCIGGSLFRINDIPPIHYWLIRVLPVLGSDSVQGILLCAINAGFGQLQHRACKA